MAIVVDTSVIIGLERRSRPAEALSGLAPDESVAIAAITLSELLVGIHRADSIERGLKRTAFLEGLLPEVLVLAFDENVARIHAHLWAELMRSGSMIGAHDLIIAATALAHGYSVLTDNLRDFGRVPGLEVKQPSW